MVGSFLYGCSLRNRYIVASSNTTTNCTHTNHPSHNNIFHVKVSFTDVFGPCMIQYDTCIWKQQFPCGSVFWCFDKTFKIHLLQDSTRMRIFVEVFLDSLKFLSDSLSVSTNFTNDPTIAFRWKIFICLGYKKNALTQIWQCLRTR